MKIIKAQFLAIIVLLAAQAAFGQIEELGTIKYTPPKGFTKNAAEQAVVFSHIDQGSGRLCFITLYAAIPSVGTPQQDFASEWNNRAVKPWGADSSPKTETEKVDGWTATAGGAQIDFQGNKAFAFLNVLSGFGKTVSVLAILNDNSYLPPFQAFVESMDVDKTAATAATPAISTPSARQYDANGRLLIPMPTRQLTVADLAGDWGEDAQRISTTYVDRSSGSYVGTDNLTFRSKMSITSNGGYLNDFYAIRNGKKILDKTTGTVAISGRVLSIRQKNTAKFVIRGWLELPDMTILEICGPWYDDDVIPAEIFTNPAQGANLNQQWVRRK